MRRWLPLLIALLALLGGLFFGVLMGGDTALARATSDDSIIARALNYQPRAVVTASGVRVGMPVPLDRPGEAKRQFYLISDATGAICDVVPDPP